MLIKRAELRFDLAMGILTNVLYNSNHNSFTLLEPLKYQFGCYNIFMKANILKFILVFNMFCLPLLLGAQELLIVVPDKKSMDTVTILSSQKDMVDVITGLSIYKKHFKKEPRVFNDNKPHSAIVPAGGYTLQTGFAILLAANIVFYADKKFDSKSSTILTSIAYTQKHQVIIPLFGKIWTRGNKFNIISDNRFMNYPSQTFGIGLHSYISDGSKIEYSYLKLHETILRRIIPNVYMGGGCFYDYFWDIEEEHPTTLSILQFDKYDLNTREKSLGIVAKILYDNRLNQINSSRGIYASLLFSDNLKTLGNQNNWQSCLIEIKKYFPFPVRSENVLALWSYNWFTLGGKPPYLLLPSIGWDDFFNTGRGYIQGRFKGRNMLYLETEYRFPIVRNGLVGGVVFGNIQTYSWDAPTNYTTFIPGYGLGLRVKINKYSATNICIDYGFGIKGSHGFFVCLGEVF
jgi:hypothetical protein